MSFTIAGERSDDHGFARGTALPSLRGLRCVRCGTRSSLRADTEGCRRCRAEGVPSALLAEHELSGTDGRLLAERWSRRRDGMWSYRELLPVPAERAVTLREGATPLVALPAPGEGDLPETLVKDERRNPTGSFKDRFYSAAISWAAWQGTRTVALASSGNAAVSAAAYSAAAGLDCVVVATPDIGAVWRDLVELHGGRMLYAVDAAERWDILRREAGEKGWSVLTNTSAVPVSSLWAGVEGYKTLAHEIVEELGDAPDAVSFPVSRGDGFAGMWAGFRELFELGLIGALPRMIAAERYPSLSTALRAGLELPPEQPVDPESLASSIGNPQATVMSLRVLRESGGTAVACSEEELRAATRTLAHSGLAAERSSAASLVAVERLCRSGELSGRDRVVQVLTSHAAHQPSALPGNS
ncbi:threonine synthase [Actinopolyspora halophila]|uniref:threonine synthase n=1 Tax=Actinopolyspora halophila TaxID=1850 RepID=UPI00036EC660|nr:pyridoxal-phosphate dependent enzyme [Actinopolyspora halophila]